MKGLTLLILVILGIYLVFITLGGLIGDIMDKEAEKEYRKAREAHEKALKNGKISS